MVAIPVNIQIQEMFPQSQVGPVEIVDPEETLAAELREYAMRVSAVDRAIYKHGRAAVAFMCFGAAVGLVCNSAVSEDRAVASAVASGIFAVTGLVMTYFARMGYRNQ